MAEYESCLLFYKCLNIFFIYYVQKIKFHKFLLFIRNEAKTEGEKQKITSKTITFEESKEGGNYMSIVTKNTVQGPNVNLAKGPRDELLL